MPGCLHPSVAPARAAVLLASLWAVVAPAVAGAEESAADARVLESVVVTATRMQVSLLEVTEAISVIDAEEIRRQAPAVLAEMLRAVPGGYFQQTTPGQGIPIIRGLKGSQVLHLVDGMRLNNAFFRDAPNQYLALVDSYAVQRTEMIRGSAPSLYGADAMGGVVQVLTAEPGFEGSGWAAEGGLYGSYGSADSSLVTRAEAAAGREGIAISGGFTYADYDDRRVGGGDSIRPSAWRSRAADFKWRQSVGRSGELLFAAQYLEQPSTPRVDELVPGYGQATPSSSIYEFMPNRRDFLRARYRLQGDSPWFERLEIQAARQTITDDRLTQDYGDTALSREWNESVLDGLTAQFNSPWGAEAQHELVWGAEYYTDEISSARARSAAEGEPGVPVRARFPDGSTMDSYAIYASNHWNRGPWTVDAGLRYSAFDIRLPAVDEVGAVELSPSDLTGDLHLGYALRPGLRLLANAGRGFRPPNVFDLGTLGARPGNRFNIPNPDLQPESVWSYDLGIRLSTETWQLEAFAWYSDYRDKIGSRLTGETTPSGRLVVQSDNLNRARLYGAETGVRYVAGEHLEFHAVLNYTWGEERDADGLTVPADRVPPLSGRVGLTWWPREHIRVEPYVDFSAAQDRLSPRDLEDPRIHPLGTPGWGTMNVLASWQLTPALEWGLKLQNLADRDYREHGSGIDAPGRNLGVWFSARLL